MHVLVLLGLLTIPIWSSWNASGYFILLRFLVITPRYDPTNGLTRCSLLAHVIFCMFSMKTRLAPTCLGISSDSGRRWRCWYRPDTIEKWWCLVAPQPILDVIRPSDAELDRRRTDLERVRVLFHLTDDSRDFMILRLAACSCWRCNIFSHPCRNTSLRRAYACADFTNMRLALIRDHRAHPGVYVPISTTDSEYAGLFTSELEEQPWVDGLDTDWGTSTLRGFRTLGERTVAYDIRKQFGYPYAEWATHSMSPGGAYPVSQVDDPNVLGFVGVRASSSSSSSSSSSGSSSSSSASSSSESGSGTLGDVDVHDAEEPSPLSSAERSRLSELVSVPEEWGDILREVTLEIPEAFLPAYWLKPGDVARDRKHPACVLRYGDEAESVFESRLNVCGRPRRNPLHVGGTSSSPFCTYSYVHPMGPDPIRNSPAESGFSLSPSRFYSQESFSRPPQRSLAPPGTRC